MIVDYSWRYGSHSVTLEHYHTFSRAQADVTNLWTLVKEAILTVAFIPTHPPSPHIICMSNLANIG